MKYYVGWDVSMDETAICIVDCDSYIAQEGRAASDPDSIKRFLLGTGLTFARIGLEACPLAQRLYEGVRAAGLPTACIGVRHAGTDIEARRQDGSNVAQRSSQRSFDQGYQVLHAQGLGAWAGQAFSVRNSMRR